MTRARTSTDPATLLGEGLAGQLALASADLRNLFGRLLAPDAATRVTGLDAVLGRLLSEGSIADDAHEALPYLVALATAPRYQESTRLLVRLASFLSAIDDPPRRLAGAGGTERARRAYDVIAARLPSLLRMARSSRDPEAARISTTICARFPQADGAVRPLLVALLSGARDPDERGRLLYALTRLQASEDAPFSGRIAEALQMADSSPEKIAVSMALAEHDPPAPLRGRVVLTLRAALANRAHHRDPTTWGDRLSEGRIERLLEKLGAPAA